jgi:hypothetical protein
METTHIIKCIWFYNEHLLFLKSEFLWLSFREVNLPVVWIAYSFFSLANNSNFKKSNYETGN